MKVISKEIENSAYQMWLEGFSVNKISVITGLATEHIHLMTVDRYQKSEDVETQLTEAIVEQYEQGTKASLICSSLNISDYILRKHLKQAQVMIRPASSDNRVNFFDEDFFETIDSEPKAYWLGFMFADGSVSQGRYVRIKLSTKDRGHIEKFMSDIKYSGTGIVDETNDYSGASSITLGSAKMVRDLIEKGCVPKKSKTCPAPTGVPDELFRHFARGVTDGDGHLRATKPSYLEVCGSYDLMDWLVGYLGLGTVRPHNGIYRFSLYSSNAQKAVGEMYRDSSVHLQRKKDIADSMLSIKVFFKRTFLTDEQRKKILVMSASGTSTNEIVKEFNSSTSVVRKIVRSAK